MNFFYSKIHAEGDGLVLQVDIYRSPTLLMYDVFLETRSATISLPTSRTACFTPPEPSVRIPTTIFLTRPLNTPLSCPPLIT